MGVCDQKFFARLAHLGIGFDTKHAIAVVQQHARENAGAGGDIGDDGI
jgi:hypothetical protein